MAEISMTISEQNLLEKCREIELLCKELYDYFAELYFDNEEAVHLWRKTASEEQNHAEQFTLIIRLKREVACQVTVDPAKVEFVLAKLRTVIDKVKVNPPKLADALLSAIKLEKYLVSFHLGCVAVFEDKNYKTMFKAMMASDQEHIASLQSAYDELEDDLTFTA